MKKVYRDRNQAKGLCIACNRPAEPDRVRCSLHLAKDYISRLKYTHLNRDKVNRNSRQRRQRRKETGKCIRCGGILDPTFDSDRASCMTCRERTF